LLQDVLDLRSSGWEDKRPKKIEGPLKLNEVAAKAAQEIGFQNCGGGKIFQKVQYGGNDWDSPSWGRQSSTPVTDKERRLGNLCTLLSSPKAESPKAEKTTKQTGSGAAMLEFLKNRKNTTEIKEEARFDSEACKREISATCAELRVSHDVPEAVARIAKIGVPVAEQPSELNDLLICIAEDSSADARKVGFKLVADLILEGHWKAEAAAKGVHTFLEDTCADLKCDVPALPRILREEFHPAMAPLVKADLIKL
jgi:hypothetical protein